MSLSPDGSDAVASVTADSTGTGGSGRGEFELDVAVDQREFEMIGCRAGQLAGSLDRQRNPRRPPRVKVRAIQLDLQVVRIA